MSWIQVESCFFTFVFRWPVTYNLRNCLRRAYIIAWGSLRVVWFLRGAYASLRAVGFAYAAHAFCLLSIVAWGFGTTNHKYHTNQGKMNEFSLLPTRV